MDKLWKHLVKMYQSLKVALETDKEEAEVVKRLGQTEKKGNLNLFAWFKLFWVTLAIMFVAVFVIWNYIKPRPKGSHHGYNKYGERY